MDLDFVMEQAIEWPEVQACTPTQAPLKFEVLCPLSRQRKMFETAGQACSYLNQTAGENDRKWKLEELYQVTGTRTPSKRLQKLMIERGIPRRRQGVLPETS